MFSFLLLLLSLFFPDSIGDIARFPAIGDVDEMRDVARADRDYCVRELSPPCEGGPLVDPACQPEWDEYWTGRRDAAVERLAAWQSLFDAEFALYPDRVYPSTEWSLDLLARDPVLPGEWDCWRRRARKAMGQLRGRIGADAYGKGRMP